ncbi:lysylphosphatidylglycerol synthase transmembrane domain-containing protein [Longimicrobium sp.]|uniref:lysylphosphatidylglycerol synthase transmembrane domain-containing protein n=1 Tax=Longimicrobium sp. TaxID=2029185 RepID=UPI002BEBBDD5|nr:lysylphosphatidylglycerol synthase transmembrane domain-containing protein [Longimicrobium sp.]HSU17753.1 lysylphosphatidylglycerol synthase transmembrane domain-containing protein [Longimicrobium sp.]
MTAPPHRPPDAPKRRLLDRLFRSALVLVPLGVVANIWWTWYATDHSVFARLGNLPRQYLLLALSLGLAPWLTNATRMWLWGRFMGVPLSWRDNLGVTLGSELAASVVPTSSGTEVMRWGIFVQKGVPQGRAISIVTLCWLQDSLFFALAIPVSIVVSRAWELPVLRAVGREARGKVAWIALVAAAATFGVWLLWKALLIGGLGERPRRRGLRWTARMRRRTARTVGEVREVRRMVVRRGKRRFVLTLLITAVQWSCRYSVVTALAYFLAPQAHVDPVLFFLLQWVVFTALNFVPTPGASGGAEAAFVLVYSALLPEEVIGIATAGWRFLTFYLQLGLGSVIFTGMNVADARRAAVERRRQHRAARA